MQKHLVCLVHDVFYNVVYIITKIPFNFSLNERVKIKGVTRSTQLNGFSDEGQPHGAWW